MGSDAFGADDLLGLLMRANLVAACAILAVLALRWPIGRRFGARAAYALWALVPLASLAVLLPARQVRLLVTRAPASDPAPVVQADLIEITRKAILPHVDVAALGLGVWAVGAVGCLVALALSQHAFRRALGRLRREGSVYRAEAGGIGPVLLGVLRPRIVLPADFEARFNAEERAVVLAHEQVHLRNRDHLVNAFTALSQCLCWFNPLVHLAAFHLRVDQELACDAAVIERHPDQRRNYAEAMVRAQFSGAVTAPLACHWPGRGAHPLKRRIAQLQEAAPGPMRRGAGLGVVTLLALGAAATAWAAQPPQVNVVEVDGPVPQRRAVAARLGVPTKPDRALVHAARVQEYQRAAGLLDAGADPNTAILGDGTPLMQTARRDDPALAELLISRGADVNAAVRGDGNALILAARAGHIATARVLVAHGADVNAFVLYDETPLVNAARSDDLRMVKFLVEHGADVNLAVPSGNDWGQMRSPLRSASAPAVKDYLRSQGARD